MNEEAFKLITDFLDRDSGLSFQRINDDIVKITQSVDGKSIEINRYGVEQVLEREDSTGQTFLQVNFSSGSKILLTKSLVGFKPIQLSGLDFSRVPNVVTTPDLLSIVEALSEFDELEEGEISTLRIMFASILEGGEAVGFNLSRERLWLSQMLHLSAVA